MQQPPRNRLGNWLLVTLCTTLFFTGPYLTGHTAQDGVKRLPLPGAAALKKADALVLEIFQEDLDKAQDADSRTKLAGVLLQQSKETKDDPAARYVLLKYARDLAAAAGDAPLTLQVVEELTRDFDIPPLASKAAALAVVVKNVPEKEPSKALAEIALNLLNEAVDQDNYSSAKKLGDVALMAAKKAKSFSLVASVQKRIGEIAEVEKGFSRMQPYLDRLKKDPQDAEANLELGKYFALLKGKWDRGLPFLARGADAALQAQAKKDLTKPQEGSGQLAVADGWWDLAEFHKDKESSAANMKARAGYWYEQVIGNLTGINRTKAEKRLKQIAALGKSVVVDGPPVKVGLLKTFDRHSQEVKCVAFSPNGKYGLSGSVDNTMRLWDLSTGKEIRVFQGHSKEVWGCTFTPTGQPISASWDGTVKLWDIKNGKELRTFIHPKDVNGVAVSADGKWLLTGCDDSYMRLWDLKSNKSQETRRYSGHSGYCYGVAFSPDMKYVASGSQDKTVRIYELATGNKVREITGPNFSTTCVAFSPDSRYVFACGDSAAHKWEIATGREVKRYEASSTEYVNGMALSTDGRRLLTGHDDNSVRLWDVFTGKEIQRFPGHTMKVLAVAISADGRRALSGGTDNTVRLWGLPR